MQSLTLILVMLTAIVMPRDPQARVHDFAGLLSADQKKMLENLSREVDRQTTAELAIVTVNSLDGKTVDQYANELINKWGVGKRDTNNGVVLLVAPNERRMRIEVGWGLEPLLTDALCGEIRDQQIIPRFRANDYRAGIVAGAQRIADVLRRNPQAARGVPGSTPFLLRTPRQEALVATMTVGGVAVLFGIAGLLIAARRLYSTATFVTLSLLVLSVLLGATYFLYRMPRQDPALLLAFGTTGLATVAAWGFNFVKYRRFGPHGCSKCGTRLELLSEQDDDAKLSVAQRLEEEIGSVDYDVWVCPACLHKDTERYVKAFSGFSDCAKCRARAFKTSQKEIIPATTSSAGKARIDGRCLSCNHKTVKFVALPKLASASSSTSGGWSGGGGGGFGGGGGGFGGGGGGGGGASGGW